MSPRSLIVSSFPDFMAHFSTDGGRIAFVSARTGYQEIWRANDDGTGQIQLTNLGIHVGSPRWSPDGATLVFDAAEQGRFDILSVSAEGAVSPDGRFLAVSARGGGNRNRDIWIHDPARRTKTRLTFDKGVEANPTWSPSGREVTYDWQQQGDGWNIASKAADGTGEATVLVDAEQACSTRTGPTTASIWLILLQFGAAHIEPEQL